ncbi:basic helix-loop-helix protein [Sorochytrium milnesiophthora]
MEPTTPSPAVAPSIAQLLHSGDPSPFQQQQQQLQEPVLGGNAIPPPVHPSQPTPGSDDWLKNRRESHKEVERRRREVINNGINDLAKIVPNCTDRNKGGILHRAVQYIQQLKEAEQRNAERWTLDKMLADQAITDLTAYVEFLKAENETLRTQITQLGGEAPPRSQGPPQPNFSHGHPLLHHAAAMAGHFPGYFQQQMWAQMNQINQMGQMPNNPMHMFQAPGSEEFAEGAGAANGEVNGALMAKVEGEGASNPLLGAHEQGATDQPLEGPPMHLGVTLPLSVAEEQHTQEEANDSANASSVATDDAHTGDTTTTTTAAAASASASAAAAAGESGGAAGDSEADTSVDSGKKRLLADDSAAGMTPLEEPPLKKESDKATEYSANRPKRVRKSKALPNE